MEPPPFSHRDHHYHHHQNRYVPHLQPPNFPDDDRFQNSHYHHHHLPQLPPPSPPPQPPPPPPPLQPLQPPFDLHRSQFNFLNHHPPIEDNNRRRRRRLLFDFNPPQSPPPRVRNLFEIDRPAHWGEPQSRVLPDHHPNNRPLPIGFDHESPPQLCSLRDRRPISSYGSLDNNNQQHGLESNFHFRDDYIGCCRRDRNEEFLWGRTQNRVANDDDDSVFSNRRSDYVLNTDRSSRNIALGDLLDISDPFISQDLLPNGRNYELFSGLPLDNKRFWDGRDEDERSCPLNQLQREGSSFFSGMENSDYSRDDGGLGVVMRRENALSELDRSHGQERGNGTEFIRTPKKKIQRKSALQRIQLGKFSHRNRNHDQHFSKAYFDESKPSSFKGKHKDSFGYLLHGGNEERQGSPVELDVSFKSNALVAKAILAPYDSAAVGSFRNLTPRNRSRKFTLSDSPHTNSFEDSVRPDMSTHGSDCPSSSEKAPKQLSKKITDSGDSNACDIVPEPCVSGVLNASGTSLTKGSLKRLTSNQGCTNIGPEGTLSLRIKKRKRVRTLLSSKSNSLLLEQNGKSYNEDGPTSGISAAFVPAEGAALTEAEDTSLGEVTTHDVIILPSSHENGDAKMDEFPFTLLTSFPETNSIGASLPNTKRKLKVSASFNDSESQVEQIKIGVGAGTIDRSAYDSEPILGCEKDLTEMQTETTLFGVEQCCENEGHGVASAQTIKLTSKVKLGMPNPGELTFSEDHVGRDFSIYGACDALSSAHGLTDKTEHVVSSHAEAADTGSEKSLESFVGTGEILNVVPLVECNSILGMSKAEEIRKHDGIKIMDSSKHEGTKIADSSKHDLSTTYNGDTKHTGSPSYITDHNTSLVDCDSNLLGESLPVDGCLKPEGLLRNYAVVGSRGDRTPKVKRKRKHKSNRLSLFGVPKSNDIFGNVVSSARDIDTSLCSPVKNLVSADKKHLVSSGGDLDVGFKPCTAGDSDLYENNLNEVFSGVELSARYGVGIGPCGTSPKYTKKRKVFSPGLSSSMPSEFSVDASVSCAEAALYIENDTAPSEEKIEMSGISTLCSSALPTCKNQFELENNVAGRSVETGLAGDGFAGNCLKVGGESISACQGEVGQKEDVSSVVAATANSESCIMDKENGFREDQVAVVIGIHEQVMHGTDTLPCGPPLAMKTPDLNQGILSIQSDNFLLVKDNLPSIANNLSLLVNGDGVSTHNSGGEFVDSVPDRLSNMGSPENSCINSGSQLLNTKSNSSETICGNGRNLYENSMPFAMSSDAAEINTTVGNSVVSNLTVSTKIEPDFSQNTKSTMAFNSMRAPSSLRKNLPISTVSRTLPPKLSLQFSTSRKDVHLNHFAKPRTWHRTAIPSAPSVAGAKSFSSPVLPQIQWPRDVGNVQSSYIRKGNSLLRKPSPGTDLRCSLNPSVLDELPKSKVSESKAVAPLNSLSKGRSNASMNIKASLPHGTEPPRSKNIHVGDTASSPLAEPPPNYFSANVSDPLELTDNADALKLSKNAQKLSHDAPKSCGTSDHQTSLSNSLEIQIAPHEGHLVKKIIYVKRKSNQLVAASNSGDLSAQHVDQNQALSSDGYYKKRDNQLIRTSLESLAMQKVAVPDDKKAEGQWVSAANTSRSSGSRLHHEGLAKTQRLLKCSLVWSRESTKKDVDSLRYQKMWPHLFPWKRVTYWKKFMHNLSSIPSSSAITAISRKLLLSRQRNAIYRRSACGFSLHMSKVLSIGGSSLKWSKSIEKRSRKANEEATLAVAAAEKKRKQIVTTHTIAGTKFRNQTSRKLAHGKRLHPGERIFRIGSVRYKMDPTRRTLQRISDDEGSSLVSVQSDKNAQKSYIPRRLLIGNDEYVRICNGNQLVRNPKRRTRILASEKVRWSLHTARLRLCRKKYCLFFTRFGKCNKDDGKCPYIHDPSKIAVCTKFLNGSCSDANCKLTHKVIPERTQDCSYFLQGLCSNENCPYRHVNVNPNASVCQGFLRGYCVEGNECQKKHSYICPIFESTGTCPQGSKCKLHHPKNRKKGMKKKSLREQKNAHGRYFGAGHINIAACRTAVSEKHSSKKDEDLFFQDGKCTDFISLDTGSEDAKEFYNLASEQNNTSGSDISDAKGADLDQLIKPVGIMYKNLTVETPSPIGSPSGKTASSISSDFDCCK